MRALLVLFAIIFAPSASLANNNTGNFWLGICESKNPTDTGACAFFIAGYAKGRAAGISMQAYSTKTVSADDLFCIPQGVSVEQLRLVVLKSMKANPQFLHLDFAVLITLGLEEAFPCVPVPSIAPTQDRKR